MVCVCVCVGDPEGQFSIDRMSGLISTGVVSLDRETQADYSLTVTVMDANSRMVWAMPDSLSLSLSLSVYSTSSILYMCMHDRMRWR